MFFNMRNNISIKQLFNYLWLGPALLVFSCKSKPASILDADILKLKLKTGSLITCGPPGNEFGLVSFPTSLPKPLQSDFDKGIAILHSFEYDESEKMFA